MRHMQAVFAKPPELLRLEGLPAALPPETFRAGPPGAVFTHNCRRSARLHDPGTAPRIRAQVAGYGSVDSIPGAVVMCRRTGSGDSVDTLPPSIATPSACNRPVR